MLFDVSELVIGGSEHHSGQFLAARLYFFFGLNDIVNRVVQGLSVPRGKRDGVVAGCGSDETCSDFDFEFIETDIGVRGDGEKITAEK